MASRSLFKVEVERIKTFARFWSPEDLGISFRPEYIMDLTQNGFYCEENHISCPWCLVVTQFTELPCHRQDCVFLSGPVDNIACGDRETVYRREKEIQDRLKENAREQNNADQSRVAPGRNGPEVNMGRNEIRLHPHLV